MSGNACSEFECGRNAAAVPDVLWLPSFTRVKRTFVQAGVRIRQIALGSPIKKEKPRKPHGFGVFRVFNAWRTGARDVRL